jgi:hypothetical protein
VVRTSERPNEVARLRSDVRHLTEQVTAWMAWALKIDEQNARLWKRLGVNSRPVVEGRPKV